MSRCRNKRQRIQINAALPHPLLLLPWAHNLSPAVYLTCVLLSPSFHPPIITMAEKDPGARLRRAVKGNFPSFLSFYRSFDSFPRSIFPENNLFLVKRLVQRTDQRNPDSSHRRYTSLCWAAVLGHEETFEFLLENGHDQDECSRVRSQAWLLSSHRCS